MLDTSKLPITRIETLNDELDNIKQLIQSLTTRIETLEQRYVTETYYEGDTWYRIWSDGWIEQGGIITSGTDANVTVQLLKPMTTTNYQVFFSETDSGSPSNNSRNATLNRGSRTTTSFSCYHNRHTAWYVYGY